MASRMPIVFIPHGGGPWPFVEMGIPAEQREPLAAYLRGVGAIPSERPTVMTSPNPPLYFDYYGFPEESYRLTWPAPGQPALAARTQELLRVAGFKTDADDTRGFDHGTFVPLKLMYPAADVPTIQLSLIDSLDPAEHLALGRALAPLRDEGVFIIGSGMTFHNLRAFRHRSAGPVAETFDAWLREAATLPAAQRDERLIDWAQAPAARLAHPREEHLLRSSYHFGV